MTASARCIGGSASPSRSSRSAAATSGLSCRTSIASFSPSCRFSSPDRWIGRGGRWASLLSGRPGFATSPDPRLLQDRRLPVARRSACRGAGRRRRGSALLGIELPTRRRNRLNGASSRPTARLRGRRRAELRQLPAVHPGALRRRSPPGARARVEPFAALRRRGARADRARRHLLRRLGLDAGRRRRRPGVDVSHRGGKPGLRRHRRGRARWSCPTIAGNRFFNTLGNLARQSARRAALRRFRRAAICCSSPERPRSSGTGPRSTPSPAPSGCGGSRRRQGLAARRVPAADD